MTEVPAACCEAAARGGAKLQKGNIERAHKVTGEPGFGEKRLIYGDRQRTHGAAQGVHSRGSVDG
jgi:hypothetical protein